MWVTSIPLRLDIYRFVFPLKIERSIKCFMANKMYCKPSQKLPPMKKKNGELKRKLESNFTTLLLQLGQLSMPCTWDGWLDWWLGLQFASLLSLLSFCHPLHNCSSAINTALSIVAQQIFRHSWFRLLAAPVRNRSCLQNTQLNVSKNHWRMVGTKNILNAKF